ncbi:MAG: hypothetical protein GY761_13000, partial [Hyphomicrobiales bacterium]|nr:hypothetical protein [Hyphomicrobiales bacterium]
RRIITCDAKAANSDCRLTDPPKPLPGNHNRDKFTQQRYKAMKDLAQGWNFWDTHLISSQASSVLVANRGVIEGKTIRVPGVMIFARLPREITGISAQQH